jgi:hypothetical protein
MTLHRCPHCLKDFSQKGHLESHLTKKKKPCVENKVIEMANTNQENEQILDNSTEIIAISTENIVVSTQNIDKDAQNSSSNHDFYTGPPAESNIEVVIKPPTMNNDVIYDDKINHKIYKCSYCDLICSRSDSLSRHIDKYCKNKKHFDNLEAMKTKINDNINNANNANNTNNVNNKYEKLVEDNIKLMKMLGEYELILKENNLLKNSIPSIVNNNNTNNTNNTNNNTNTNNTNNGSINNGNINTGSINSGNTINIVQFGKEDISKCDLVEMMNVYLKSTGGNIMSNMLKYLNFNPNYPQNFNILMTDLAREYVKIHNGKKFVTKKFKTVKNDILNVLSGHITLMCNNYITNPKIKKSKDILSKMNINNISVKLINDDDIIPLLKDKGNKGLENKLDEDSDIDDLTPEQERKLTHYESKRQGLQEITEIRLKDELYNNKDLVLGK